MKSRVSEAAAAAAGPLEGAYHNEAALVVLLIVSVSSCVAASRNRIRERVVRRRLHPGVAHVTLSVIGRRIEWKALNRRELREVG